MTTGGSSGLLRKPAGQCLVCARGSNFCSSSRAARGCTCCAKDGGAGKYMFRTGEFMVGTGKYMFGTSGLSVAAGLMAEQAIHPAGGGMHMHRIAIVETSSDERQVGQLHSIDEAMWHPIGLDSSCCGVQRHNCTARMCDAGNGARFPVRICGRWNPCLVALRSSVDSIH
jgi:hypothetical protein